MAFEPADTLKNRTFIGLIVAQFLAGFNDQAIHAAAMFYAIHRGVMTEAWAITIMPILFYVPWAVFCTSSAYLADRYSKTTSCVAWKFSEILIALLLMLGFYLGTEHDMTSGVWLVLSGVFMMGTHAAFFSPAKYGAMPQILQPHLISRGNGVLESSTFLANILGTVAGGMLSDVFLGREIWIGAVLLVLALIGAGASLLMQRLPPSKPDKKFQFIKPLTNGFRVVFHSRPLALSVMGIAFFIFMVTYMRSTMYMHGQTRVPPWGDFHTSLVVATVALGVGFGSPLAGWLSGGKIELGLVPIGCIGMIFGTAIAAGMLQHQAGLVTALIVIGFFSGFYMVPLYSLLQHRSPVDQRGEIVAFSNFVNVTGAMLAPALFFLLVQLSHFTGLSPLIDQEDVSAYGIVTNVEYDKHMHVKSVTLANFEGEETVHADPLKSILKLPKGGLEEDTVVVASSAHLRNVDYYWFRNAGDPMRPHYNNEALPKYLFLGAAGMTLAILLMLWRKLPDFFVRTIFWWGSLGRYQLKAVGMRHLPMSGPVILATNCDRMESCLQMVSATDRSTLVVMAEHPEQRDGTPLLRTLAKGTSIVTVPHEGADPWASAEAPAEQALRDGNLLAVTVDGHGDNGQVQSFLTKLRHGHEVPVLPVWCGALPEGCGKKVRVVFGEPIANGGDVGHLQQEIDRLGEWIRDHDATAGAEH
jgi:MFS family permease